MAAGGKLNDCPLNEKMNEPLTDSKRPQTPTVVVNVNTRATALCVSGSSPLGQISKKKIVILVLLSNVKINN